MRKDTDRTNNKYNSRQISVLPINKSSRTHNNNHTSPPTPFTLDTNPLPLPINLGTRIEWAEDQPTKTTGNKRAGELNKIRANRNIRSSSRDPREIYFYLPWRVAAIIYLPHSLPSPPGGETERMEIPPGRGRRHGTDFPRPRVSLLASFRGRAVRLHGGARGEGLADGRVGERTEWLLDAGILNEQTETDRSHKSPATAQYKGERRWRRLPGRRRLERLGINTT